MKIIKLHNNQTSLIKKAITNNREAQKQLFAQYSPKMLGVCRQYVKDLHHAEDLLLQGFLKVFTNLHQFKNEGSFEGWIRRIMVNTCISYLRKKNVVDVSDEDYVFNDASTSLYVKYDLNPLFKNTETRNISFGIRFDLN